MIAPLLFVLVASSVTLAACSSQYPDTVMFCQGSVNTAANGVLGSAENQTIGMRVSHDKISLTGNLLQGIDEQKVCRIGSNEFAKKDELFFDSDGCQMNEKSDVRKYGTYNFITTRLSFTMHLAPMMQIHSEGDYECTDAKR